MNNKLKRMLILLFVVSTLLLMIGSVSANTDELNENLEASLDLDDGISVDADDSISSPNNKVSNQELAISNIDEETDTSESIDEDINLNSKDVVSNKDTTINTKDSDENIKTEDGLDEGNVTLDEKPLSESINQGEVASFEILVQNNKADFDVDNVTVILQYWKSEYRFLNFTASENQDNYDVKESVDYFDQLEFTYNTGGSFAKGDIINFTVNFRALGTGTMGNRLLMNLDNQAFEKIVSINVKGEEFKISLDNKVPQQSYVGEIVSFNISAYCESGYFDGEIPIDLLYSEDELHFINITAIENPERFTLVNAGDNYKRIIYNATDIGFKKGSYFNFTVNLLAYKDSGWNTFGTYVYFRDFFNGIANSTKVSLPANFTITNTALNKTNGTQNPWANLGNIASFEIFVSNTGSSDYNQKIIPVDIYFNPEELEFVGIKAGTNPDWPYTDYTDHFSFEEIGDGHVRVYYAVDYFDFRNDYWFGTNHCFNFSAQFKTIKTGEINTTAVIDKIRGIAKQFNDSATINVGQDAVFNVTYKPTYTIVNVNDPVSFEFYAEVIAGIYNGQWVGIDIIYDNETLNFINFTPAYDDERYYTFDENGPTPNPLIIQDPANPGHLYFGYNTNFYYKEGDNFKFIINFEPLVHEIPADAEQITYSSLAYINTWQIDEHHVEAMAEAYASDADFVLKDVSAKDVLKVGDMASFDIVAYNRNGVFYGSEINFDVTYDPNDLRYLGFDLNEHPSGEFVYDSDSSSSGSVLNGILTVSNSEDDGHLHFVYTPVRTRGANENCNFNFTINFQVENTGTLKNNAVLTWGSGEDQKTLATGRVYAGDASFNLTKTAYPWYGEVDDIIRFDVVLINNGTLPYYNSTHRLIIDDWYPAELEFVRAENNTEGLHIYKNKDGYLSIVQDLTADGFTPGSVLNASIYFKAKKSGIHCNHVFAPWNTSTSGTVVIDYPDLNLTKEVQNQNVDLNEVVYFDVYVKNNGSIEYFDHTRWSNTLIINDVFSEGLKYISCDLVEDTQGGRIEVVENSNTSISIKYTPNNGKWAPGEHIKLTLAFKATQYGKLPNVANVYWKWKDWDHPDEPERDINLTDDAFALVGQPDFALEKISNFETAKIGDIVSFTIIYTNTGKINLTGVYIIDNEYSQGLVYSDYLEKSLWTFDGKDTWYYNSVLEPGDQAVLTLMFKATSTGQKNNTAIAGNNELNYTKNSTDIVLIKDKESDSQEDEDEPDGTEEEPTENDEPAKDEPKEEPDVPEEPEEPTIASKTVPVEKAALPTVGNPLAVLLLSLLTLCFVPLRGKK